MQLRSRTSSIAQPADGSRRAHGMRVGTTPRLDRQRVSRWVRAPGRPKYSDGDRERLRTPLNTGASWHTVSTTAGIPQSRVQEEAHASGYPSAQSRAAQGLGKTSGLTACKTGFQIATAGSRPRAQRFLTPTLSFASLGPSVISYPRLGVLAASAATAFRTGPPWACRRPAGTPCRFLYAAYCGPLHFFRLA